MGCHVDIRQPAPGLDDPEITSQLRNTRVDDFTAPFDLVRPVDARTFAVFYTQACRRAVGSQTAQAMDRTERDIRNYANHLALTVPGRGSVLALYERYDERRKIGEYRTLAAVKRAIVQYGEGWLRDHSRKRKKKRR